MSISSRMKISLPEREYAGYIFDCDGTLGDNMPLHYEAWKLALGDCAWMFPEDVFYSWGGVPTGKIVERLNERHGTSLGVEEIVHRKEAHFMTLIPQVQPVEPVVEFAKGLLGRKPMAVASGGHRELVEGTLHALGIREWFPVVVCAEDYERGKPHPDPFLLAAELLGVEPTACVVFEDSPTGIIAAKAAGMDWVHVDHDT